MPRPKNCAPITANITRNAENIKIIFFFILNNLIKTKVIKEKPAFQVSIHRKSCHWRFPRSRAFSTRRCANRP